jgi:threonine/homoserine/homoserine lactone efflux protein
MARPHCGSSTSALITQSSNVLNVKAIGTVIGPAMGAAITPVPIMVVVVFLLMKGGRPKAWAYGVGAIVGLSIASIAIFLGANGATDTTSSASTMSRVFSGVVTALFFFFAYRMFTTRPRKGEVPPEPGWMTKVGSMNVAMAFVMGAAMLTINAKNLPIMASLGPSIAAAGGTTTEGIVACVVFAVIASLGVLAPSIAVLFMGDHADATLAEWKTWLLFNNKLIMAILFVLLGANSLGSALGG